MCSDMAVSKISCPKKTILLRDLILLRQPYFTQTLFLVVYFPLYRLDLLKIDVRLHIFHHCDQNPELTVPILLKELNLLKRIQRKNTRSPCTNLLKAKILRAKAYSSGIQRSQSYSRVKSL